ncbi:hypothetical protein GGI25_004665 [Coemansia spiralis]|uniref:Protein kinase domain-containing protein n=1 Tax=Coemansia spiralis TaxID=417178 RepID=A0A9W8KX01_9FUNG|nr:hypothetical protein GGI25_004665 [Coemansia spiralis]
MAPIQPSTSASRKPDIARYVKRCAICKAVREHLDKSTYYIDDMVEDHLELKDEYDAFKSAIGDKFEGLVDEIMDSTHEEEHPAANRSSRNKVEREMANYFEELFLKIMNVDKQDMPVSDTNIKPKGIFCFPFVEVGFETTHIVLEVNLTECNSKHIPDKTLGQIGDYVLSVWSEQPLRTFVPVLILHRKRLDLLLFARSKVVKVMLGQIYRHSNQYIGINEKSNMQHTLHDLWFILTLAPEKFGHICAVDGIEKQIIVKAKNDNGLVASINTEDSARDSRVVLLDSRIKRPVNLFGRVAYLFWSQNKNPKDNLVAKISWIPTDRFSECTAYSTLRKNGVTGVPEVLYYGALKADFLDIGWRYSKHTIAAASTLVHAYDAGILHRDISAGNRTVKGENAYVIDWGFSMFTGEKKTCELADNINSRMKDVLENKYSHSPFTGTPLYMGIQTLCGSSMRSTMHDIESLFMVVLHALAALNGSTKIADDAKYG